MLAWSEDARVRFQTNTGDSVGQENYRAYDLVGSMGRRLLRSLGRSHLLQAHAVQTVLDSLGLNTEIAIDPSLPGFVLLMVRNPFRVTADAVGFLYWYRGDDLRMQGVVFRRGQKPKIRVWWTGQPESPYEWAIVDQGRDQKIGLLLLRLNPGGTYWILVQYEDTSPELGGPGEADWVDINGDNRPELVTWVRAHVDSSFQECDACPHLITERTYIERENGFELHDSRLLPSPYASFVLFIRLLRDQNRQAAARLLENPARLSEALASGWGSSRRPGTWRVEYAEQEQPWPRWLAMKYKGPKGDRQYIVHFSMKAERWIIKDWIVPRVASQTPAVGQGKSK